MTVSQLGSLLLANQIPKHPGGVTATATVPPPPVEAMFGTEGVPSV
jgi:hypothetical protein